MNYSKGITLNLSEQFFENTFHSSTNPVVQSKFYFPVTRGKTNALAPVLVETWRMKQDEIMLVVKICV